MAAPKYTIADFNRDYPTEDACLETVFRMVYPDGVTCRKCGIVRPHHRLANRKAWSCDYCGTHVYPLAGTIFEKSTTPLKSWFYAMFLMASTRCGISAKQLERELGVTYKTAWRMFDQIRKLMDEDDGPLWGEVEVDETFVGGKLSNRHRSNGEKFHDQMANKMAIDASELRSNPTMNAPIQLHRAAYGAIQGRVQTLSETRGLRFVLYDVVTSSPVSCYLREGHREVMRGVWGRKAIVEGLVTRDTVRGFPVTVREVELVEILPEVEPGSYRKARGVLPRVDGEPSPEERVRALRDAE